MAVPYFMTGADDAHLDGSALALVTIVGLAALSILSLLGLAYYDVIMNESDFNPAGLGGGISAILGGLAAFLAGIGTYIMMERRGQFAPFPPPTVTTTTTTTPTPPIKPSIGQEIMEAAGRGTEPMPEKIGPEDVGKKPLLSKSTKRRKKR